MDRRNFLALTSAGAAATVAGSAEVSAQARKAAPAKGGKKPILFKLGCQTGPSTDEHFAYLARYGVTDVAASMPLPDGRLYPTVQELTQLRERAEKHKLKLGIYTPPMLGSSHTDRERNPSIMRADSPQRDRDIEAFQMSLRNCAAAGIPTVKYNMSILGVLRTARSKGRGDGSYSTWSLSEAQRRLAAKETVSTNPDSEGGNGGAQGLTKAGPVNADAFWERITYFLDRVVPVANETKVKLACHPHDPGVPPAGYQGVDRVLGTVDGLKKFVSIRESPYHGFNFCQGTVAEMLQKPGDEIYDVIRWFGERKKIFNVHFRNIRGHRDEFVETYPDEGDVDMVRAAEVYRDVGYDGMLMPDHVPQAPGDPQFLQSFAFCYGYIRGVMQTLERTA